MSLHREQTLAQLEVAREHSEADHVYRSMNNNIVFQTCLSSSWGGLEMVTLETAQSLSRCGIRIITACPPGSPLAQALESSGLEVLPILRRRKYFCLSALRHLRSEISRLQPQAVLVQHLNDLWQVVPALSGLKHMRLVGVSHTFLGVNKNDFYHRWLYGRVDALVALTERHRQNLIGHLPIDPMRILVLPNSVDMQKFNSSQRSIEWHNHWAPRTNSLLVGIVGRLDPKKGLFDAVEAAALWRKWGLDIQLVILGKETCGEPGTKARLQEKIQALGLKKRVHLAGHFEPIAKAMASFDTLLMPSPAETFGRVLIEAMASGVPVVATDGGGVPDIIHHELNGLLAPAQDSEGIARAVRRYYDSPELRKKMAAQALSDCQNHYAAQAVQRRLWQILGLTNTVFLQAPA